MGGAWSVSPPDPARDPPRCGGQPGPASFHKTSIVLVLTAEPARVKISISPPEPNCVFCRGGEGVLRPLWVWSLLIVLTVITQGSMPAHSQVSGPDRLLVVFRSDALPQNASCVVQRAGCPAT